MSIATALVYWVIVGLWLAVLTIVCSAYRRNPRTFGTARLLLFVIGIDTCRNLVENIYFGFYFGAQYGLFPSAIVPVLGNPYLLIVPKLINIVAASIVIGLLLRRWLPKAAVERRQADADMHFANMALAEEIEENRRLFDTTTDLILVMDRDRIIRRISQSCEQILGYDPAELVGRYGGDFVRPEAIERARAEFERSAAGRALPSFEVEFLHKSGRPVTIALAVVWSGESERFFAIGRDTTERRTTEERLARLAHFDELTGLPNRASLMQDLTSHIGDASGARTAIALFDLDGFKDINDTLGHALGDRVLQETARRFGLAIGSHTAYRLGGDEFVVIIRGDGDPRSLADIVTRALSELSEPMEIDGHRSVLGASAGIAIAPEHGRTADELLGSADLALYEAKRGGGRQWRLFDGTLRVKAFARQELASELSRAFIEGEFVLHFQPQIRVHDEAVVAAEALLRWRHPRFGLIGPASFLEALVRSPIAAPVGTWILRSACARAASWHKNGKPIRIGVNLFAVQLSDGDLPAQVRAALAETGLPPEYLELEITEDIALASDDRILASLTEIRAMGVGIAFDDFGTGYASLSYLTKYPLTHLKIDRSFVQKISADDGHDAVIVRSILAIAHNLGLEVVAEGVETREQLDFLAREGCDEVQGFLYGRPMPFDQFEASLRDNAPLKDAG